MICSIHENYGMAPDTFEIVEPEPPIPVEQFASYLKELLKEHVEITDVEVATLFIPSEEGKAPKAFERIMINIDTSLRSNITDYPHVVREAADILHITSAANKHSDS